MTLQELYDHLCEMIDTGTSPETPVLANGQPATTCTHRYGPLAGAGPMAIDITSEEAVSDTP